MAEPHHPYLQKLLETGKYVALKPYDPIDQGPALTAGVLMGTEGCIQPTPTMLVSTDEDIETTGNSELFCLYFLGDRLSGHKVVVHGGLLATLLDEALCRCGFQVLPHKVGVTASLHVDYKQPTPTSSWLLLRAITSEIDGRKVWVDGETFVLPAPDSPDAANELGKPTMKAKVLVVEPVWYEKLLNGPATRLQKQREEATELQA